MVAFIGENDEVLVQASSTILSHFESEKSPEDKNEASAMELSEPSPSPMPPNDSKSAPTEAGGEVVEEKVGVQVKEEGDVMDVDE